MKKKPKPKKVTPVRGESGYFRCTAATPCPPEDQKSGGGWIHPYETTYEGSLFNTVACPHCGHELKTSPAR